MPRMVAPLTALLDDLFSPDPAVRERGQDRLRRRRLQDVADAEALLAALRRPEPEWLQEWWETPWFHLLAVVQAAENGAALAPLAGPATALLVQRCPQLPRRVRVQCLAALARLGTPAGLAAVVTAATNDADLGPSGASIILEYVPEDTPHAALLFPALTPLIPAGGRRAEAVVALANGLVRSGQLPAHPAAAHLPTLAGWLRERGPNLRLAEVACAALDLIPGPAAAALLADVAAEHPDPFLRVGAAAALVRREAAGAAGAAGGPPWHTRLAAACRDPLTAAAATAALRALGRAELIPPAASDPEYLARSQALAWLARHRDRPQAALTLWDRRLLFWPPTGDRRELFLYRYRCAPAAPGEPEQAGVICTGSQTWDLIDDSAQAAAHRHPYASLRSSDPADAYAAHCLWELRGQGDPRGLRDLAAMRRRLGFR